MPYEVKNVGGTWRVIDSKTRMVAYRKPGVPIDGGGHNSREKAMRQIAHLYGPKAGS